MGWDYALVHLKFTIPLAAFLLVTTKPFLTRLDTVRIAFITTVAVIATIPWDSYLIRTGVWSYPPGGVLGPSLFAIPIEELFFFVIQTFITSLLYILFSKPVLQAQYLTTPEARPAWIATGKLAGQAVLGGLAAWGGWLVSQNGDGTYLGLIFAWACPFALLTWTLTADMILAMPWLSTLIPILAPTFYLWVVDELSLSSGVWSIEGGTKYDWQLFGSLEIEEAVFFLVSNVLVVFGIAAFDKAVAVCDTFPDKFERPADALPVPELLRARFTSPRSYDMHRINGIKEAVSRLQKKSRSFYIASSVFPGRLRIDLTLLYSFCRLADDLVDDAASPEEAMAWIAKLQKFLEMSYGPHKPAEVQAYIYANFPPSAHSALELVPTHILSDEALYALLEGFRTDVLFNSPGRDGKINFPIETEEDLETYGFRVAGTIGMLCLDLVFHHTAHGQDKALLFSAASEMGIALQFVNIARDVSVDAALNRVYIPTSWLKEEGMTPSDVLKQPTGPKIEMLRKRLLGKAFERYRTSRPQMDLIPSEAKGPMTVAVESYMEIGRVLAEGGLRVEGKATVPVLRRMGVVWKTLMAK
ncbi:squalene/phytoene synthase domain-containing protein [Sarocladium implicatum]|nr:squalene/phytoene synthase domain-containing protein [Sarocladium implicatum]